VEVDQKGFERWLDIEFMVGSPGGESQYIITDSPALLPERVVIWVKIDLFQISLHLILNCIHKPNG
jgi:hypothetical protein